MIHDVDEALRTLIKAEGLGESDVEVVLDAPRKDWAARCTAPTVDLFLYDIREQASRRQAGMIDVHDEAGRITARKPYPRVFRLSYLITAWTQRAEDEHRLLTVVLACFLRHDRFPPEMLSETLRACSDPPRISIAQGPPQDRQISEIWTSLGGELKASLDLNVSASIETGVIEKAAELVRETPRFRFSGPDGVDEAAAKPVGASARGADLHRNDRGVGAVWESDEGELVHGGTDAELGRSVRVRGMPRR
ncbi:MAG: DUF4255 domain-containing protein [Acidimicrobiales bacterium]